MSKPPNIIFIMVDQMRYDAAGFAGNSVVKTPTLDRMAGDGIAFDAAYCGSPVCSPARACSHSGLYPHGNLQLSNYSPRRRGCLGYHLPYYVPVISDVLQTQGYECGMVGNWHLGNDETPQRGFTSWTTMLYQNLETDSYALYLDEHGLLDKGDTLAERGKGYKYGRKTESGDVTFSTVNFVPMLNRGEIPVAVTAYTARHQRTTWDVDRAIDFVRDAGDPFYLHLSIKDPHPPIFPPEEFLDLYKPSDMPVPDNWQDSLEGKPEDQRADPRHCAGKIGREKLQIITAYYYALITHIDNELARLIKVLEEMGIYENTVIAFTSDHGEMLGNHGLFTKRFMYEESARVPLIVQWPAALPRGIRSRELFAGVDLMPTLLELAGCQPAVPIHGRSIAAYLKRGAEPSPNKVLSEIGIPSPDEDDYESLAATVMLRTGHWKYVCNRYGVDELYDMNEDPAEMTNLVSDGLEQNMVKTLQTDLRDILWQQHPGPYRWVAEKIDS